MAVNHSTFIANANPDFHHGLLGPVSVKFPRWDIGLSALILHFRGIGLSLHDLFHTEEGLVMSTTGYMSPEQVRGQRADPRGKALVRARNAKAA